MESLPAAHYLFLRLFCVSHQVYQLDYHERSHKSVRPEVLFYWGPRINGYSVVPTSVKVCGFEI
jgi:hypothetical protein